MAGAHGATGDDGRLGVAEICAVSYVILWEALERQTLVMIHAALIARMFSSDVDVPDLAGARASFDAALVAPVERVDTPHAVMRRALGLR